MKIEICEQMLQSWLLNYKLCEIAEVNWKISPLYLKTISSDTIEEVQKFLDYIKEAFSEFGDIFENIRSAQFIKQCEIDVVGIKLDNGVADHVYLMDSAFHKNGLGYGDLVKTVVMKIVRAAVVSKIVFGDKVSTKVIFTSPLCKATPKLRIETAINKVMPIINKYYPNVAIDLYFNEDFSNKIYKPLIDNIEALFDDNDLFMRAMNLAKEAEKHLDENNTIIPSVTKTAKVKTTTGKTTKTTSTVKTSIVSPTITLVPSDISIFKDELLKKKRAEFTWIYSDGTQEDKTWNAKLFNENSDLINNIKTRPQWKNKNNNGLVGVVLKV